MEKRAVCLTVGPMMMLIGGTPWLGLLTVLDHQAPVLEGWDWWWALPKKVFDNSFSEAGWMLVPCGIMFLLGTTLVLIGVWTILGDLLGLLRQPANPE